MSTKRWRFFVSDLDGNTAYVDAEGGNDGDTPEAEFVGDSHEAMIEGDRRSDLWESRTGFLVAKITRESRGTP